MTLDKRQFRNYVQRTHCKATTGEPGACVIANFLRDVKDYIYPSVTGNTYRDNFYGFNTANPLPNWAQKVIDRFDALTNKGSDVIPAHRYRRSVLRALAA